MRAFRRALHLAAAEGSETLYVIRIYSSFDAARATLRTNLEPGADHPPTRTSRRRRTRWRNSSRRAGPTEVPIDPRCIRSNTGFAASDFVQAVEADLLVVPVEATPESDGIPAHIAWVTDVIPCNLWIIR